MAKKRNCFTNFFIKTRRLIPFLWPTKNFRLQFIILICLLCLVLGRVVNVFLPIWNKRLINNLTVSADVDGILNYNWKLIMIDILIYVGLRFLQGNVGLLSNIQTYLWIDIAQVHTRHDTMFLQPHKLF